MRHLASNRRCAEIDGNVAAIFAVILFPMMLVVAAMVDTARQVTINRHVQIAVDSATLAGALLLQDENLTDDDVETAMMAAFRSNSRISRSDLSCSEPTILIKRDDHGVDFSVDCLLPKIFGATFSKSSNLPISKSSYSELGAPTLDVALMLDMSGSMTTSGNLGPLKAAANALISSLVTTDAGGRMRVALIPYGEAVNAGIYGNRAQGKADDNDDDGDGAKVCVTHREDADTKYTDAAPSASQFVGDLAGDVCDEPMIVPLTSDVATLQTAIAGFAADGYGTAGQIGLAWSWYAISSKWNAIWPEASIPNDNANSRSHKAIVMMTDGVFNRHHDYGGREEFKQSAIDIMALCKNILDSGVPIYVIALNVTDPSYSWVTPEWLASYGPDTVLSTCAGDAARLFRTTASSELTPLYEEIAKQLETEPLRILK